MKTIEDVKRLVAVLTDEQQQLLKDTINKVCWVTPTAGERDSGTLQGNVSTVVQNFGRQCL